jgi:hypothetical protein
MKTHQTRQKAWKRKLYFTYFILFLCFHWSCKKDKDPEQKDYANLQVRLEYLVNGAPLVFDSLMYTNAAGELYSVSKLEYFLSRITLHGDGTEIELGNIDYLNAADNLFNLTENKRVPYGHYSGLSLLIGLDSQHNLTDALPHTIENENMAWPVPMGGGYHFMKFEGRFGNLGQSSGFAVHLGRNINLVKIEIPANFDITSKQHEMVLIMDLNEWFANPWIYSLINDGSYTMHSAALMKKISENGSHVLKFKTLK